MNLVIYILEGFFAAWIFEIILTHDKLLNKKFWKHHIPILGYHVHHSIYGLICILIAAICAFVAKDKVMFFLGFGWGIILRHTVTDRRFVFLEKIPKK